MALYYTWRVLWRNIRKGAVLRKPAKASLLQFPRQVAKPELLPIPFQVAAHTLAGGCGENIDSSRNGSQLGVTKKVDIIRWL